MKRLIFAIVFICFLFSTCWAVQSLGLMLHQKNVNQLTRMLQIGVTNSNSLTTMASADNNSLNNNHNNENEVDSKVQMPEEDQKQFDKSELLKPICVKGVFSNPWKEVRPTQFKNVVSFTMTKSKGNVPSSSKLNLTLPVLKPKVRNESPTNAIRITWIGHATSLVQFEEVSLLTCPVFSKRVSLSQWIGPKRYRPVPLEIDELPSNLNAVLISHNHYDHLDLNSVKEIHKRYGDQVRFFVGLGLKSWFNSIGIQNVIEMTWWQEEELFKGSNMKVVFLPAQHWSKRTLTDTNRSLWGSFAVIGSKFRFYYAGDTGYYEPLFKQIGQVYGPFDLAAIPIGAYEPNWFLRQQHVKPSESVEIHQDVRSRFSVGVHWGTFELAKEHYLEPQSKLKEALESKQLSLDSFVTFKHGESRLVFANGTSKLDQD